MCFNPRPCARGDTALWMQPMIYQCFNPRPCARGDSLQSQKARCYQVSIHAPVQGATINMFRFFPFNAFQSTPLCKGRPASTPAYGQLQGFNPRPCARGDVVSSPQYTQYYVSIHAPVQGATLVICGIEYLLYVSIHAPVQGATQCRELAERGGECFNPRPCARGDSLLISHCF